jgi:hypothetical protein
VEVERVTLAPTEVPATKSAMNVPQMMPAIEPIKTSAAKPMSRPSFRRGVSSMPPL